MIISVGKLCTSIPTLLSLALNSLHTPGFFTSVSPSALLLHPRGYTESNLYPHMLTFKYCRFEKILPQPGKSQGSSSLLAAFLSEENRKREDSCRHSPTSLLTLPYPGPLSPVLPNSLGANLSSVLIPCRGQSRLSLTPRAMGSKEGAEGLEGGPCPRTPLPSVSAIRLPGQGLSLLVCLRGPPELWLYPDFYRPRSSRTQRGC